jgi:hypothetical protein
MSLAVRRVSLTDDREEILEVLKRNFGSIQEQRFDWRHRNNPAGECWSWFVQDRGTKSTVAMVTVFPRHMRLGSKRIVCGQVGEFAVNPTHRSLGPAVLVQRTTFQPVDSGALAFCYDCVPHDRGMSTFVRLGMRPNCEVIRYALPLRSDEYWQKRLGSGGWTRPLIGMTNLLLRFQSRPSALSGLEICKWDKSFDDEFSYLDEVVTGPSLVRASRSAVDLNWRYREDPLAASSMPSGNKGRYQVFVARRGGELLAFVVFFIQTDGIASLVDLFGRQLSVVGKPLLKTVIEVCRRENVSSVNGFCSHDSELRTLFTNAGFRPRETNARVVAYARPGDQAGKLLSSGAQWAFSQVEVML